MSERDSNRVKFPKVAAFVDMVRKFDPQAKVVWCKEGEHELGDRKLGEKAAAVFGEKVQ